MSTTVPQNIKGSNIMGSHLPTRNSLRHSRMLVGKKTYQGNEPFGFVVLISSNLLLSCAGFGAFIFDMFHLWIFDLFDFLFNLFPVFRRRNPLNIRHPNLVKYKFYFHILVGLGVSCLGLWLCWWAPSTSARDNPYWSGLIVSIL